MPEKSVKKTATKKPVAKKVVAKPATVKKPVAKKAPVKKAPVVEPMHSACQHTCCECACSKKKCAFGSFLKKFIVFLIVFGMGFATAKMCCMGPRGKMAPRPEFETTWPSSAPPRATEFTRWTAICALTALRGLDCCAASDDDTPSIASNTAEIR